MSRIVILTMAGRSERFAREGVQAPKWQLAFGGMTMLEHALRSLEPLMTDKSELRVVIRQEDADSQELLDILSGFPWPTTLHTVDGDAPGQAIDATAALDDGDNDRPIVIWCVDTIVHWSGRAGSRVAGIDGNWLLTARLAGEHWSFARTDEHGVVVEVAEKRRIASNASAGMYGFATARLFRDLVDSSSVTDHVDGQLYVAPLYNRAITRGETVNLVTISPRDITVVGTPDEVLTACRRHGWSVPRELRPYAARKKR